MRAKSLIALVLMVTFMALTAAPPASAELVTVTVALIVAFAGTVAVTEAVRHEQLKGEMEEPDQPSAQRDQADLDTSPTAATTP
jgi:hypothetical protein